MKKSLILIAALAGLAGTQAALAVPGNISVRMDCPDIANHGNERVTNFGTYLAGPGIERVGTGASTFPIWSGLIQSGQNIPVDLVAALYHNDGTSYDPNSGIVTCKYASSLAFSSFNLTYKLNNGLGGIVTKSSSEEINLMLMVGAK